jgi:hypothetical protein
MFDPWSEKKIILVVVRDTSSSRDHRDQNPAAIIW